MFLRPTTHHGPGTPATPGSSPKLPGSIRGRPTFPHEPVSPWASEVRQRSSGGAGISTYWKAMGKGWGSLWLGCQATPRPCPVASGTDASPGTPTSPRERTVSSSPLFVESGAFWEKSPGACLLSWVTAGGGLSSLNSGLAIPCKVGRRGKGHQAARAPCLAPLAWPLT